MIKIAYIIDTIETPSAGTEKQLLLLLNGLDKDKFKPYLICLHDSQWLRAQDFDFRIIKYDVRRLISINCLRYLAQFIRFLKNENIDIVQTFFIDANIFGTIAAGFAGIKTIISSRRNIGHWHTKIHILVLRILARWTSHFLANSKAAAEKTVEIEKVDIDRIDVIYNGMDLRKFMNIDRSMRQKQREEWNIDGRDILVGTVSNLRNVKNIDSLIKAAAGLCIDFPNLKFVVIGEGIERDRLQTLIHNLCLSDKFLLAGEYSDIIPCLTAFDIAVLCSKFESFSNALIEYMAAGLPIIASDVGGNSEAISHNETGLLYPVDNDKELENALRTLIKNEILANKLAKQARQEAFSKYSLIDFIKNCEKYYFNALKTNM